MKVSFSVVLPSGWKLTYQPFGGRRGIPLRLSRLNAISEPITTNFPNIEKMKRANPEPKPIEIQSEVVKDGSKPR